MVVIYQHGQFKRIVDFSKYGGCDDLLGFVLGYNKKVKGRKGLVAVYHP